MTAPADVLALRDELARVCAFWAEAFASGDAARAEVLADIVFRLGADPIAGGGAVGDIDEIVAPLDPGEDVDLIGWASAPC